MRILMVCLGNICRSPIAEGVLQFQADKEGLGWKVDSAGTELFHIGSKPHELSCKVAGLNNIDISQQVARQFKPEDFDSFDKIYVMARDVLENVKIIAGDRFREDKIDFFLNELYPGEDRNMLDPWYGTEKHYHMVYEMIDETCKRIIEKYKTK